MVNAAEIRKNLQAMFEEILKDPSEMNKLVFFNLLSEYKESLKESNEQENQAAQ